MIRRIVLALALLCAPTLAEAQGVVSGLNPSTGGTATAYSPPKVAGRYYHGNDSNASQNTIAANRLFFKPLVVTSSMTISELVVSIVGASAGNTQVVICASDPATLWPTSAAPLAGVQISTGTAGTIATAITTGTGSLPGPALYWQGIISDTATPTYSFTNENGVMGSIIGATTASNTISNNNYSGIYYNSITFTSGTFTCGPGGAPSQYTFVPQLGYKVASVP